LTLHSGGSLRKCLVETKKRLSCLTAKSLVLALSAAALSATEVKARQPLQGMPAGASSTNVSGPKIRFATTLWDFGREKAAGPVKYTYVFTNCGDRVLEVKNVQPSCGCIPTGEWSKQVEPNKTGTIPIQLNSAKFNGPVSKTLKVTCNDPTTPEVTLRIKGTVWVPVEVKPLFAFLSVAADSQSASKLVRIINNEEEPLTLFAPESDNRAFAAEVETNQPGREFRLVIKTVPPLLPGPVQGKIVVKTSSTNTPVLEVSAFANVPPIIAVTPSQLSLPPGPLAAASAFPVILQNNSTNALVLSDANINVKDVGVDLRVIRPGRRFRATLTFPPGFELTPGQQVELTLKSSNPLCPLVKVPVVEATPPTAPAARLSEAAPELKPGSQ
jgi:hypothetical protein